MKRINKQLGWIAAFLFVAGCCHAVGAQTEVIGQGIAPSVQVDEPMQSTWQVATKLEAKETIDRWLQESNLDNQIQDSIRQQLKLSDWSQASGLNRLDAIVGWIQLADPKTELALSKLRNHTRQSKPPTLDQLLADSDLPFVRQHKQLFLGRWLVQNEYYDEGIATLSALELDEVLDRRALLFYVALANHQLLRKSDCLVTLEKLLEQESSLPTRFSVLSKMMLADMKPLKDESLDTISRLMSDIRRRTSFNRSGKTVLEQENEVIERLDQLIEQLEAQQQQQQSASSPGGSPGAQPMQDSKEVKNMGDGKVTRKEISDGGEWGDLPPAKRAAALAEMAKDMPPHYRTAIEEYFRRLAKENKQLP